jgi:cytoskeletal protein CcmA (bactofilin family)
MNHFDEMTCMLYLDGQLDRARAAELATHAESCAECRQLLGVLEQESRLLREALVEEEEAVPARVLSPPAREAIPWGWMAALGFGAAAGAYTLWAGVIEPWREQLEQVGFGGGNLLTMLFFGGAFWKGWTDMIDLIQFLATGTLLLVGVSLLARLRRRWTTVAVVMGALGCLLVLPSAASAAEIQKAHGVYTLPAGKVVNTDLVVFAASAKIDGTVEGDLIVFAGAVTVNGEVKGDVIGFARTLRISGKVGGDARIGANSIILSGTVAKNVMAFAQQLDLDQKAEIGGSLTVFGENIGLDGRVGRDLFAAGQNHRLAGFVGGNARLTGLSLVVDSSAEVKGTTEYKGREKPEVSPDAKLASPVKWEAIKRPSEYAKLSFYWWQALKWAASFVFGMVLVWLAPVFFREALRGGERIAASFGAGVVTLAAPVVVGVIACVTVVGLAVGLTTLVLWIVALYSAKVFAGAWLGEKMLGESSSTWAMLGRMALGLLILRVGITLPYVGFWITILVLLWGLGLLGRAVYRRISTQPALA